MSNNVLYHFTCEDNLPDIGKSKCLKLTTSNFCLSNLNLHPVVWLTDSPTPEGMGLLFDPNIPDDLNKTRIRFTIKKQPYMKQWDAWSKAKGMDENMKQILIETASAQETYKTWYISEQIIPLEDWLSAKNMATGEVFWKKK